MSDYTADQHRDWHTVASLEGVNAWECPWDCMDGPDEDNPVTPWATVWYVRPGTTEPIGYTVFSRTQARLFATVAAERTGKAVRVELVKN